ncbi:RNA-directed DNA polymerase from mobile element jockey [Willisornis vidua]|uniref:RNA-directed DNA polymerase from mobile element jockey n=1 Tax=Willisornis vidua TaxID=1566151 RepID=A0ABQ9D4N6_9PASS|nr:RNA-directed DNA polymerase from mobile element jockey [Willisornis vidua]
MDDGPRGSHFPELEDHNCKNYQLSVGPEIVQDLLLQLDPYKSMGPDEIATKILKDLADVIAKPLLMVFEQSWESGEVSADWKLVNVPILNYGKKKDLKNYRVVSLTSILGNIVEKIILGNILEHLKEYCHWSQPAHPHERKVLLIQSDFLL